MQESEEERQRVERYMFPVDGPSGCRRAVLDEYLDGYIRQQCESDESACDGCHGEWIHQETPISEGRVNDNIPSSPGCASPGETRGSGQAESPPQIISHASERVRSPARQTASPARQISCPAPQIASPARPIKHPSPVPDAVIPSRVPIAVRHKFRRQDIERAQLSSRRP